MRKKNLIFCFHFVLFLFLNCGGGSNETLPAKDAYQILYSALIYKASVCGSMPPYILYIPKKPLKYGIESCAFSIVKSECPFDQYPWICLEIYHFDIPNAGPDILETENLNL